MSSVLNFGGFKDFGKLKALIKGGSIVDIGSYLTMKCRYKAVSEVDPEFRTPTFGEEQEKPCFKYGDKVNVLTADTKDVLSDQTYLLDFRPSPGDLIDGQVVKSVYEYPDFDGSDQLFEVKVTAE